MRPGRATNHSPPSNAAVMEEYSYTSTHPLGHTGPVTGSLYLCFTLVIYKKRFGVLLIFAVAIGNVFATGRQKCPT